MQLQHRKMITGQSRFSGFGGLQKLLQISGLNKEVKGSLNSSTLNVCNT